MPIPLATAWIQELDQSLLHWINCELHTPGLQDVLVVLQSKDVGIPLVIGLCFYIAWRRGREIALRTLLTCALAFLLSWGVAAVFWQTVARPRPPRGAATVLRTAEEIATCAAHPESVSVRKYVSSRPGLPSQHALHSAGFAMALFLALRWVGVCAAVYALLVGFSRVFMAAHWPTDVLLGFVIGPCVAIGAWWLLPRALGLLGLRAWVEAEDVQVDSKGTAGTSGEAG